MRQTSSHWNDLKLVRYQGLVDEGFLLLRKKLLSVFLWFIYGLTGRPTQIFFCDVSTNHLTKTVNDTKRRS